MKRVLILCSVAAVGLILYGAFRRSERTEYKIHQKHYLERLRALDPKAEYPIKLRQVVLRELGRIDRCVTCHVGMEDPRMANEPRPILTHPGRLLHDHDPQRFGCTICHDGQGRATIRREAHANLADHWERKRLFGVWVQSTCVRCHASDSHVMMPWFVKGRELFLGKGCLGCHQVRGRGGRLGPELTTIADASPHVKAPVDRQQLIEKFNGDLNAAYIFESVFRPKAQPHDSRMLEFHLTEDDALALSVYLKSFRDYPVPGQFRAASETTPKPDGRQLFGAYCSACHGPSGEGRRMPEFDKIIPAISNPSFLAIVDREFLIDRITDSGSSLMPAWGHSGGLTEAEIEALADYLLAQRPSTPSLTHVLELAGSPEDGRSLFRQRCAGCHGDDGEHETDLVGPTLASRDWLAYADDAMIYATISSGRRGTAMPAWGMLSAQDFADLLAYFRAKRAPAATLAEAQKHMRDRQAVAWGGQRFKQRCGTCHGETGGGGIGPSLNSPELLALASDEFLYRTITEGRPGTAMGRQTGLSAAELGWLLAYVRSLGPPAGSSRHFALKAEILGRESAGANLFARICAQCHGPEGVGHIAPAIGNPAFLRQADDAFIKEMAAYGRTGTGMKPNLRGAGGTASLSERQLDDIVAYLRSLASRPVVHPGRSAAQGDIPLGRRVFGRFCAQCHGSCGSGGQGPGIGRAAFLAQVSDGFLQGTIANGRVGTEMKGFANGAGGIAELSDHEIRSVVRYLRSGVDQAGIRSPQVLGTPTVGERLFEGQCRQCHGKAGLAGMAPQLGTREFLGTASDAYLQATMSLGREGTAMRSVMRGGGGLVEMTSRQAKDIVSYLREQSRIAKQK